MKKRMLWLLLVGAAPLAGQEAETAPLLPVLAGSTRAAGLGGAYPAGSPESDAIFYNPAYGERLRGASLGVQWAGSATTLYTLSAGTDWWGGALGVGVMALDYQASFGDEGLFLPGGTAELLRGGNTAASERAALVSYGRRVKGLRLAVTGKLLEQRVQAERNTSAAADVGTVVPLGFMVVGLAAQNLGPGLEVGGREYDLPQRGLLQLSTPGTFALGPLDVLVAGQLSWVRHGELVPAAGVELGYWPVSGRTFFVRGGVRRALAGEQPFTVGGGFQGDKIVLDYAFVPYDDGDVHRIGIRWR